VEQKLKVYSRRKGSTTPPDNAIYVGRPTKWGNPFVLTREGERTNVLEQYKKWIYSPERSEFREKVRRELRGHDLICWCAPKACHADVLLEIANSDSE
jgi:hypothetical protein